MSSAPGRTSGKLMRPLGARIIAALALVWACAFASAVAAPSPSGAVERLLRAQAAPAARALTAPASTDRRTALPTPSAEEAEGPEDDETGLRIAAPFPAAVAGTGAAGAGLAAGPDLTAPRSTNPATGPPGA